MYIFSDIWGKTGILPHTLNQVCVGCLGGFIHGHDEEFIVTGPGCPSGGDRRHNR